MKPKYILPASLILNLALLAVALALNRRVAIHSASEAVATQALMAAQAQTRQREAKAEAFQWSGLESQDLPAYIANLRGIGCPERAVRRIIAGEVADLFAPRREPLLVKLAATATMPAERSQAQSALDQLRQEEVVLFRRLFGIPDPVDSAPPDRTAGAVVENTAATLPLVFQPVDTNTLKLTEDQIQTVGQVRQSFLTALGTNQDVNSPEYFQRWQTAQQQADDLLGGLLGRQDLLQYQAAVQSQNQDAAKP